MAIQQLTESMSLIKLWKNMQEMLNHYAWLSQTTNFSSYESIQEMRDGRNKCEDIIIHI